MSRRDEQWHCWVLGSGQLWLLQNTFYFLALYAVVVVLACLSRDDAVHALNNIATESGSLMRWDSVCLHLADKQDTLGSRILSCCPCGFCLGSCSFWMQVHAREKGEEGCGEKTLFS